MAQLIASLLVYVVFPLGAVVLVGGFVLGLCWAAKQGDEQAGLPLEMCEHELRVLDLRPVRRRDCERAR
jgi:hypothetical protein